MGNNNAIFLETIEWFDATGQELVHRIPEQGSGDIKYGAQLTVRESQAAVFFYQGRAIEAFGAGRHTLKTANIPVLTRLLSLPWGLNSPLRAEVYFVNAKVFANLKWGTRDPVAFKDSELGLIRLRTFGVFNLRVTQPIRFVNRMVGTQGIVRTEEIGNYLNEVIVSRFNDYMGGSLDSILNLPARYDDISTGLAERLAQDFAEFGLALTGLYITSITPPPEVQQAIDDRSRMGVFQDMQKLMQMKAAMAMEAAATSPGDAAGGLGLGVGLLLPSIMAGATAAAPGAAATAAATQTAACSQCGHAVSPAARFCPACGNHLVVFATCARCGEKLAPEARFCAQCGQAVAEKPKPVACPHCRRENLPGSVYCNHCGEKLG